jgi:uncharacterized protein with PIN domain
MNFSSLPADERGGGTRRGFSSFAGISILFVFLLLISIPAVPAAPGEGNSSGFGGRVREPDSFEASFSCSTCHMKIYQQFSRSMHDSSFINPFFQKMYFDILLTRYAEDEWLAEEVKNCMACHSPVAYLGGERIITSPQELDSESSGVECDICHRITGYKGDKPGGGNYLAVPGMKKFGPYPQQSEWHHAYAELQTKSEFCAICHNRVNRFGLEIIATFTEWQRSRYAAKGIQCQDCHMNRMGFLTGGKAIYESGQASQNSLAVSPVRERLYTHRFPGAHSRSQVEGAIRLEIRAGDAVFVPGEESVITVIIDNSRSGHKLPTGTAELRLLYLDLEAVAGERRISLIPNSRSREKYDVSGTGKYDAETLGEGFPPGKRIYRAICVDPEGRPTNYSFDAEKIIFDNRLEADEVRKEFFLFRVPPDIGPEFVLTAKLFYIRYPDAFALEHGMQPAERIELASDHKLVALKPGMPNN